MISRVISGLAISTERRLTHELDYIRGVEGYDIGYFTWDRREAQTLY